MATTPRLFLGAERRLDGSGSSVASCLPVHHLVTHGVVFGTTGSGKTGLVTVLIEEALRSGIPVLAIDVKGDLPNLLLSFPSFAAEAVAPWASGQRKTAHVLGAVSIERRPYFVYQFAKVFNGRTFLCFLQDVVRRCPRRKVFLIIDNCPCHQLDANGQQWLAKNQHRIEVSRPPVILARAQWD